MLHLTNTLIPYTLTYLILRQCCEVGISVPILQMKKLMLRNVKFLAVLTQLIGGRISI